MTNDRRAIAQSEDQSNRAVAALRLINDALEENLVSYPEGAALLALAGLRLIFRHRVLPSSAEGKRLLALAKLVGVPRDSYRDVADDLIAAALAGKKPDVSAAIVESVKVTYRPRVH